jgi:hypothetical protein
MWLIDQLVEARISDAQARGEFDNLPGAGKALQLQDEAPVPEELRAAYRLLKNAGYLPPRGTDTMRDWRSRAVAATGGGHDGTAITQSAFALSVAKTGRVGKNRQYHAGGLLS